VNKNNSVHYNSQRPTWDFVLESLHQVLPIISGPRY